MVDTDKVIVDNLEQLFYAIQNKRLTYCAKICNNLIYFSWNLKLEEPLYVAEVLEASFVELTHVLESLQPNDFEKTQELLSIKLLKPFKNILHAYKAKNSLELHRAMTHFRFIATTYQLNNITYGEKNVN